MRIISLVCMLLINTPSYGTSSMSFSELDPPSAAKISTQTVKHGIILEDDYAWIRDPKWKEAKDDVKDENILGYITAENNYTNAYYKELQPLISKLLAERKAFIPKFDQSVPVKINDWYYYSRQSLEQNYRVLCRRHMSMDAKEEVILDQNVEATGASFYKVGMTKINPFHNLLAYSVDLSGNEYFSVKIRNLETHTDLVDEIPNVSGSVIWSHDGTGFYYVRLSGEWRAKTLCYHKLGTEIESDVVLYDEKNDIASVGVSQSADRRYLFLTSGTKEDDEVQYIDLLSGDHKLNCLASRQPKRHLNVEHYNDYFYILTNDIGPNKRLVRVPTNNLSSYFEEIIGHSTSLYLTDIASYKNGIVLETRENGLNHIGLLNEHDFSLNYLKMPESTYDLSLNFTTYDDDKIRFTYSSLAKPETTYAASFEDLSTEVLKVDEVPESFDANKLHTERVMITARDGVEVPVSLVYRKDLYKGDGSNALLLYGYGSYGYSIPAYFSPRIISLLDRGFVYAIAHIRGGDDLGYQWYLDGKLDKKWNTFNDFIDAADALADRNYTSKGNITAMGGSAGGMLMGVIANERPELFKSIIALVPFVDVMNTMLDTSLPLTPGEFVEWGNPGEDPQAFKYMLSYSPYDNIKPQAYPAILATGGMKDPRVTYWEMAKYVAKLRAHSTGKRNILLDMNMSAGHAGSSSRDDILLEYCKAFAFALNEHGITE